MTRTAFALLVSVTCCAAPARAETLPLFDGLPGTYTPGTAFTFTVRVPQQTDFTAYKVDLLFATDVPNPPLFVSAVPAPTGPGGRYVFRSNATFQSGSTLVQDSSEVLFTITDADPSVVTQPGANDTLAQITVRPGALLTGSITISLGIDTRFEHNLEEQYPAPTPVTILQGEPGTSPVPAPAGAALLGLGGLLFGLRNRLARALPTPS